MVSTAGPRPIVGTVPPPWCTTSAERARRASQVFSASTRNGRFRTQPGPSSSATAAGISGCVRPAPAPT